MNMMNVGYNEFDVDLKTFYYLSMLFHVIV